jgi:hypothetical protein
LAGLLLASLGAACGGLTLTPVSSSVQRPSNVAVFLAVEDGNEPITGLTESNFAVEEDGVALDRSETRLTLLDPSSVSLHHTVVLVDLSGARDERQRELTSRGVAHLVDKLRPHQAVTVLGFDGSARLHALGEFPKSADAKTPELTALLNFRSQDESRNLNGAVVEGLRQLDARLMRLKRPVRVGNLVVFTFGDDLAGRVPEEDLWRVLDDTPHQIYAIGVEGRDARQLDAIGKNGVQRSQDASAVPIAFEELGSRLRRAAGKYYLVQYCSPARSGVRQVRFTVRAEDREGKDLSGSVDLELDAAGFSGGCNPKATPSFVKGLAEPGTFAARQAELESKQKGSGAGDAPAHSATSTPEGPATESGAEPDEGGGIVAPPASGNYAE